MIDRKSDQSNDAAALQRGTNQFHVGFTVNHGLNVTMKIRQSTREFHVALPTQPSANPAATLRNLFQNRLDGVPAHKLDAIGSRGGMTGFQNTLITTFDTTGPTRH